MLLITLLSGYRSFVRPDAAQALRRRRELLLHRMEQSKNRSSSGGGGEKGEEKHRQALQELTRSAVETLFSFASFLQSKPREVGGLLLGKYILST